MLKGTPQLRKHPVLFRCSGKEGRLQELCEFPEGANILSSTSVYINEEFSKQTTSMCN
jgi:hypothetical protein